jgi:hypothetical protein
MQHTSPQHDPELDAQVRDALDAGIDLHDSAERSRYETAFRLDDAIADEVRASRPARRPARSRRPVLAVVGGLAAAVLIAGALAPGFDGSDGDGVRAGGPFVAADASAAEVLERAAERMLGTGDTAPGTGSTWHSISRGSAGEVFETWYDVEHQAGRWTMYTPASSPGASFAATSTYYVLDARADGSGSIRQYERAGTGAWKPSPGGSQMESSGDDPFGMDLATVESEALAWLSAVGSADDTAAVRAADKRFAERTRMWFGPPMDSTVKAVQDSAAGAMQVLYLLRIAQVQPDAVAQLYRDVADLRTLERLDDATVDGRDVIRLRLFEPPKLGGDTLETILLLDAETGAPVGTQNESGTRTSSFEPARRTGTVGDDPASCGSDPLPPCTLLRGEGPLADAAKQLANRVAQPIDPTPAPELGDNQVGNAASVATDADSIMAP